MNNLIKIAETKNNFTQETELEMDLLFLPKLYILSLPSNKEIWKLTYPILLSLFAENIINLTDTIFLARVGEIELGASAIGGTFYVILFIIGLGFSIGTQIIISRRMGEKRVHEIGNIFEISIALLMLIALLLFILVNLLFKPLFGAILSSPEVFEKTTVYVHYRMWGIFFTFLSCAFRAFYTGIFKTKYLLINALILSITNVIFAWILIFGKFGFPAMGIEGAAIATVIAELASVLFYVIVSLFTINRKEYQLFTRKKIDFSVIKVIFNVSGFIILQHLVSLVSWFMFFIVIEQRGQHQLAIANIIRSIYVFLMIPGWAFSSATGTLVSNIIGKKNHHLVIPLIKRITLINLLITTLLTLPVAFFPQTILSLYTVDPNMINDCIPSFYVIIFTLFVFSLTFNFFSGVTGTGNTRIAFLIELIGVLIYLTTIYIIVIQLNLPQFFAWFGEAEYFLTIFIFAFWYLRKGKWQLKNI